MHAVKKILNELWKFKKIFIFGSVAGILSGVAVFYITVLIKTLFDAFQSKDIDAIKTVPWFILGLYMISGFARYWNMYLSQYVGDCVSVSLRQRMHEQILKLSVSFHSGFSAGSGGIMSRIFNDVIQVEHGIGYIVKFIREPILVVSLLGRLFYLDWKLTLSLLVSIPLLSIFMRKMAKSLQKYGHRSQEELEKITSIIKESLDGLRVIQSFNLESEMGSRFKSTASRYLDARRKMHSRTEITGPVTEVMSTLLFACILTYMGIEISQGRATIGDLASFVATLLMFGKPTKEIQDSYIRFQRVIVSVDRVYELLESKSEVPEIENATPFPNDWKKIEYKNVSFRYGDEWVLRHVNLQILRGQTIALVGESGSGKSTIVSLLERFFDPTEGEILIDGINIKNFSLKELRSKIALVNQDVFLFNDSIKYNIRAGDFSKAEAGVERAARGANAHEFIMERDGEYLALAGDRGGNLSGGEKQRISIARAFFKDCPLLILDEATSALDSVSEVEVQRGIEALMKGRTVLVIAHRLSTVVAADQIVVMKDGLVIEQGRHQDLISKGGEYSKFHSLQTT